MNVRGKMIAITGASSGIGKQLALQLAKRGAVPILLARTEQSLQTLKEEIISTYHVPCYYYILDVSKEEMVRDVFVRIEHEVGSIDVLINNAGYGIFQSFEETTLEEVQGMFEVNVFGLVACTKAVLPSMRRRNSGHIINIASLAGKIATPKSSAYSATKHAVLAITNSLRMELADTNIRITAVNPGPIATNFFHIADTSGTYVKSMKRYMLQPEYVAQQIIETIGTKKREIHLPRWMGVGPAVFALFPRLFEGAVGGQLRKK